MRAEEYVPSDGKGVGASPARRTGTTRGDAMYLSGRGGVRADQVPPGIGAVGNARSLRTARTILVLVALVATAVGFIALVAIHHARPEIILLLAAAGLWLASLWYVERRSLDRELQQARVRLLDARDRERLRLQRDLHD